MSHQRFRLETIKVTLIVAFHIPSSSLWRVSVRLNFNLFFFSRWKKSSCIKHKNKTMEKHPLTTANAPTEVACAVADSELCFPAFMSIELKVSAWGHCMIERCDMETQAGSHCQRHGLHLTPQALSPWPPPTLAALEMAFSSQLALWHLQN